MTIFLFLALSQKRVENNVDRRRRERSEPGAATPHRMVMRYGGGEERKQCFAERSLCAALPHKGSSEPAVDTCCLSPVWNTGCLAAMNVAACAGVKRCAPRNAINMVL